MPAAPRVRPGATVLLAPSDGQLDTTISKWKMQRLLLHSSFCLDVVALDRAESHQFFRLGCGGRLAVRVPLAGRGAAARQTTAAAGSGRAASLAAAGHHAARTAVVGHAGVCGGSVKEDTGRELKRVRGKSFYRGGAEAQRDNAGNLLRLL